MQQATAVELFCTRCGAETIHQATIANGFMESLRCLDCDATTPTRVSKPAANMAAPAPVARIGNLHLGQGQCRLEGSIHPPALPPVQQALRTVRAGLALRELDCRVLRLCADSADHVRLATTLKAATGLPVLVDIGDRLQLAADVAGAQTDGLIFTCSTAADADLVAASISSGFAGLVVIRTASESLNLQLALAEAAVKRLCRWNHCNLAVTPQVPDVTQFVAMARSMHAYAQVPLRAELPMAGDAQDPVISTATAMGVAMNQPGLALVALPALTPQSRVMYETAGEVSAHLSPVQHRDVVGTIVYMAGKAVDRLATKPGRVLREMRSSPTVFAHSLAGRVISKPQRVMGEIQRLLRRTS
ncbi:MAG TPA: hypothetical protein VD902_15800 [Symbiobacteriaceae bacterium]|nr:hypothetical protein [Symbiobacteriaceae bacterium]